MCWELLESMLEEQKIEKQHALLGEEHRYKL